MQKTNKRSVLFSSVRLISSALLASAATGAVAQGSPAGSLEEVLVTAQKRVQSLQDAPIAISAYGTQELEQRGIRDITDLGTTAPNVKITPLPSNTAKATIAIRGSVTSNPSITWEPTVGMYLDGVFIGKFSGNTFKVAELQRIEVLRGPQGTLYGKNTIGGAVNMITQRPTGELGGKLRAGIGNYGYWEVYGSLDLPAFELGALGSLSSKITLSREERDGFYDNEPTALGAITNPLSGLPLQPNAPSDKDFNAVDSEIGRLDLLWDITDRLSARYTGDWIDVENTPSKPQFTDLVTDDTTFSGPGGWTFPADLGDYIVPDDKNVDEGTSDAPMRENFKSDSHSLFLDYNIGSVGALGDVAVKYIGNIRDLEFDQALDNDGTPFSIYHTALRTDYEQSSHEIQINGATERTDYVLGVYYFEEEADSFNPQWSLNDFYGLPIVLNNRYGFEGEQTAVYGQIEWRPPILDDRLALTGGLRWTQEEKDAYIEHPAPNVPAFSAVGDDEWTNVTSTLIANYDLTRDINVYAKYSEGFKAGGFNGESGDPVAFSNGYDPEEVKAYELGFKSRLLENTLQINVAVFMHDESDLQLSVFTSGSSAASVVRNAGDSTKSGFELEAIYQPIADLQLSFNYGYLDSEYDEYLEDDGTGTIVDKKDEKANQYAPRHTANASVEYTFARGSWGEATARLDYSYNDEFVAYVNPEQNDQLGGEIDAYGLFNGRVSVADIPVGERSTLNVALWGKNLTDEEYRLSGIPFGPFGVSYYGNPRTYGLEATLNF